MEDPIKLDDIFHLHLIIHHNRFLHATIVVIQS